MALDNNINDREYRKFVENQYGDVDVRTKEEYASYTVTDRHSISNYLMLKMSSLIPRSIY